MRDHHRRTLADDITLVETLRFSVPIYMAELVALPPSEREPRARGWQSDGARAVGGRGDILQVYRPGAGTRRAAAFEHLAKGLAACAVLYGQSPPVGGLTFTPPPVECWATEPDRPPRPPALRPQPRPTEVVELPEVPDA
ncbi:MAG TPA: hypothetical protein VFR67_06160 [Pilimelia sp.]|nr:hypothetical protein [Pilimelia sp.]